MASLPARVASPALNVGPSYRSPEEKPKATVSRQAACDNVHILPQTPQLIALLTIIRDEKTHRGDFIFYSNRIMRLLVEEGLNHLPVVPHTVTSPVGQDYTGVKFEGKICGVSIMRAGESMELALRECCRSVRIGKILIQRNEETSMPKLFYEKLPTDIKDRWVLLLDPMLATGGSAIMACEVLKNNGVPEERILFLNLIACPEGIKNFADKLPKVRVVTAFIDQGLNEKKYVISPRPDCELADIEQLYCSGIGRLRRQILHSLKPSHRSRRLVQRGRTKLHRPTTLFVRRIRKIMILCGCINLSWRNLFAFPIPDITPA